MSIASTPDHANKENKSPEQPLSLEPPQQETVHVQPEKAADPEVEQIFKSFVDESSGDTAPDEVQEQRHDFVKFVNEFIKQGGSIGTVVFGGTHIGGDFHNRGGTFVGGNQANNAEHQLSLSKSPEGQAATSEEINYGDIPLPERIERWFREHPTLHHRALMLAMAFLNGSDCRAVMVLSDALESALWSKLGKDVQGRDEESHRFGMLRFRERLRVVLAHAEVRYETKEFGRSSLEIVLFDDPDFQETLLRYIWQEEDYYWQIGLVCLKEFGAIQNSQTKVRLAAALSESCKYRFDLVREAILLPWAKSERPSERSLAALSLGIAILGNDEAVAQQAQNLLAHWSTLKNAPNLRRTAIEAYGAYVGLKFPNEALEKFSKIAKSNNIGLFSSVLEGVVNLFVMSESIPENRLIILRHLQRWLESFKKEPLHIIAALVTWGIMKESKTLVGELNSKKVPTLFWLSMNDEKAEHIVASLVRSALNLKLTRALVLEELKFWFLLVEGDSSLRQPLGRMITRILKAGNSKERLRFRKYLDRWAAQENSYALTLLIFLQQNGLTE